MRFTPTEKLKGGTEDRRALEKQITDYYDKEKKGIDTSKLPGVKPEKVEDLVAKLIEEKRTIRYKGLLYPYKARQGVIEEVKPIVLSFLKQWYASKGEGADPVYVVQELKIDFGIVLECMKQLQEEGQLVET